jgi:hypothetical protein
LFCSWKTGAIFNRCMPAGRVIHSPFRLRQLEFSLATQDVADKIDGAANRSQGKRRGNVVAEASLEDVFVDDIMLSASDGYALAATLFLPRGTKHSTVLINSATAVPRKIYRAFATYLAGRGCVVLTYDYRGIGGSRPQRLAGFAATMSDWVVLDVASAVTWIRGLQGFAAGRRRSLLRRSGDRSASEQRHDRAQPPDRGTGRPLGVLAK